MVGVPGRSKGCNTCRQRHVKCTEEKPVCSRCTRGGFTCRGYLRETMWFHLVADTPSTEGSSEGPTQATSGQLVVVERPEPQARVKVARARVPPLSKQISLDAFEEDVCFAYIFSNFVWRGYGSSWLYQSAQGLLGQLAFDSVKALAEMSFGRSKKAYQTEIQGRLKYGRALRCMIERLGDQKKGNLKDLVIPILLLLMHTAALTNQSAALFHLQGMMQIFSACGPQVFQNQPLRDAFEAARATMVVASLITSKKVFLDDPTWHEGPYTLFPQSKAPQSYLLDILTSVPGILEDHQEVERMQNICSPTCSTIGEAIFEEIVTARLDIISRIMGKLKSLLVWRLHWQIAFGFNVSARLEHHQHTVLNHSAASYSDKLDFSHPSSAAEIALYNAVLMWLLALIYDLEPLRAESFIQSCAHQAISSMSEAEFPFTSGKATKLMNLGTFEPLRTVGSTTSVRDAALEICRVFEWQSRHHAATWETNCVYMFPIGLALCVLDLEPENREWIRTMLDANALTRGYGAIPAKEANNYQQQSSIRGSSVIDNNGKIRSTAHLEAETSMLHRLRRFGRYVTRELADEDINGTVGHDDAVSEQTGHHGRDAASPNMVHLILLRGRMDMPS
ncbi:hypothetical protein BX600DRAFT_418677 [Xylariales sp. PMI_506]|nr:hypothetical protein BX600DRAFT_418677 [Xylariales sp. PMI_506]